VSDVTASVRRGLAMLSGGRREVPRHEAIEPTISWSWNLLEPDERQALSRLAIVTAPFTFRCGAIVAHDDLEHGERLLAALADKSLVSRETGESRDPRFKILGVVRNFAIRQLNPEGRHHVTRRLMYWALNFIYPNEPDFQHPGTIARLDAEFAVLRIALEGNEQSPADQVRLAVEIWPYWHIRSLSRYGCRFLAKARHEDTPLTLAERGRALGILANLLAYQGRHPESVAAAQRSVHVLCDLGDPAQLRHGLLTLLGCLIEACLPACRSWLGLEMPVGAEPFAVTLGLMIAALLVSLYTFRKLDGKLANLGMESTTRNQVLRSANWYSDSTQALAILAPPVVGQDLAWSDWWSTEQR
jgi:hypothetical protein